MTIQALKINHIGNDLETTTLRVLSNKKNSWWQFTVFKLLSHWIISSCTQSLEDNIRSDPFCCLTWLRVISCVLVWELMNESRHDGNNLHAHFSKSLFLLIYKEGKSWGMDYILEIYKVRTWLFSKSIIQPLTLTFCCFKEKNLLLSIFPMP